jgi:4-hydroxy-tetrahydrodipicolinate reductase
MKLLLIGHGRMGKLVEALAPDFECEIAGVVDEFSPEGALDAGTVPGADVAIDFSTAIAVETNLPKLAAVGMDVVIGTTGWNARESDLRALAERAGIGVVAAPNFSIGAILFNEIVARAGHLLASREEFGAWVHESHHAAKRDAPSGTALALQRTLETTGYSRPIDMASTRAGYIPGVHTVGFDAPSETLTLTHSVRDRGTFARGALLAARWVHGRRGWFTMHDCLGLSPGGAG